MDAIHALKSTLHYSSRQISRELLEEILSAAVCGHAGTDSPPCQFVVITARTILDAIPAFHSSADMVREAPLAIVVCRDLRLLDEHELWFRECCVASESILIAVQAHGLGAVRLSIHPVEERVIGMRRLLGLPDEIVPISLIPLGYPAAEQPVPRQFDTASVHYNHW